MDQTQWKALNRMLMKQASGQKSSSAAGTAGQRTSRNSVEVSRAQDAASEETENVKSLLTGRQYGQSILRPDAGRGSRQQGRAANAGQTKGSVKQATSLLPTNLHQTQQQMVDASSISSIQVDPSGLQQVTFSADMIPEGLGPDEVMYMMVGDVAYQIVGSSKSGGGVSALTDTPGISLDDLATISAQQESLKPELAGFQLQGVDASSVGSSTVVPQDILQTSIDGQQFLQTMPDGTIRMIGEDGMQIAMMAGDGFEASQPGGGEVETASTIKLGGEDFVLQAGQQLPPELQEMVAKGLPIDWSKYEFVIEGETGPEAADAYVKAATSDHSEVLINQQQEMAMVSGVDTAASAMGAESTDVYSFASSAADVAIDDVQKSITVQIITACPGEFDDGEFAYLASGEEKNSREAGASEAAEDEQPRIIPYSGFLNSFLDFVQRKGREALSGASNCAVITRPALSSVGYIADQALKGKEDAKQRYKGTPMTIIYADVADPSGRPVSYVVTSGSDDSLERAKVLSVSGKRKQNQTDNDGDSGGKLEKLSRLSEDAFDSEKVSAKRPSSYMDDLGASGRGKARGKSRGSTSTRPTGTVQVSSRLGLPSAAESPLLDSPVLHVTLSEPHFYQKGDFVIDRKDAYKLDSYPIWRIENGKLLQKFDPELEDGLFIHKSASVYSSWSDDIKSSFKPIMVEMLNTLSAASSARRQDISVRVLEKYRTKAPDESLEQNPLMQLFNIYLHVLLNQVFEPAYLSAVQQQKLEYYLEPLVQIDHLLMEAEQAVLQDITWKDDFKTELDAWSCYMIFGWRADQLTTCQATEGANRSVMTVKFYGQTYDRETLAVTRELSLANAKVFSIGRATVDCLGIYHSLHHFKFLLFAKCQDEANFVKSSTGKSVEEVVDECIQNRIWVHQLFLDLKGLLERYIIIKTDDEAGESEPVVAAQ